MQEERCLQEEEIEVGLEIPGCQRTELRKGRLEELDWIDRKEWRRKIQFQT